jgi:hypothetical protein
MNRELRLTEKDKVALIEALRGFVGDGRLSLEEFEQRVAVVYDATLWSEADAAFAELPMPPPRPAPARGSRRRRHGESPEAQAHWRPTAEVFRDPTTGRVMRVWVDPSDGSRRYVAEDS